MTVEEAHKYVADIAASTGDDEAAHSMEDSFHCAVLQHIADTAPMPWSELATIALSTDDIDFARWCA